MTTMMLETTDTTPEDAHAMGSYVTRHYGSQGAWDRMCLALKWRTNDPRFIAYAKGRDGKPLDAPDDDDEELDELETR